MRQTPAIITIDSNPKIIIFSTKENLPINLFIKLLA